MEKTYSLDQKEGALLGQMDGERTQALATIGALSLDMEQARKNLDSVIDRQRAFIRNALTNRGVERYENARLQGGALIVTLADLPPAEAPGVDARPNGVARPVEAKIPALAKE
jgi:hypothetical protein